MLQSVQKHFDIPIVCIGNLNVGGTGKTPTTISVAQFLIEKGYDVHVVQGNGYSQRPSINQ